MISGVSGVVVSTPAHLFIAQGAEEALWVAGDRALLPAVKTVVSNGILEIWFDVEGVLVHSTQPFELDLTCRTIESVALLDFGSVEGAGLVVDRLSLELSGEGDLRFPDLSANELEVMTASTSGDITVSGSTDRQRVEMTRRGNYEARDLLSNRAEVWISGSGSATIQVRNRLVVRITGSGSVYYLGNPVVESQITGSGQLVQLDG